MWRYLVGAGAMLLLGVAGMFLFRGSATSEPRLAAAPPAAAMTASADAPLPDEAPSATVRTREQKRFDRVDKDRNDTITREEYLATRRKAFARLDKNGDGRLDFEEWAVRTTTRFAGADKDKSATLTRAEFATTAVKRRSKAACVCAPARAAAHESEGDAED